MLADAAVAAGAELREGRELRRAAGRRRPRDRHADPGPIADTSKTSGPGSSSARTASARGLRASVGAQAYDRSRPQAACTMPTGAASTLMRTAPGCSCATGCSASAVPSNDDLTFVGICWPHAEFAPCAQPISARPIARRRRRLPWIADRLASATQAERFVGTGDLDGFFRTASGPGWALLGDAGLSQGSDHRAGHDRRAAACRAAGGGDRRRNVGQAARSMPRCATTASAATRRHGRCTG